MGKKNCGRLIKFWFEDFYFRWFGQTASLEINWHWISIMIRIEQNLSDAQINKWSTFHHQSTCRGITTVRGSLCVVCSPDLTESAAGAWVWIQQTRPGRDNRSVPLHVLQVSESHHMNGRNPGAALGLFFSIGKDTSKWQVGSKASCIHSLIKMQFDASPILWRLSTKAATKNGTLSFY